MAKDSIGRLALFLSADTAQLKRDLDKAGAVAASFQGKIEKDFAKMGEKLGRTWQEMLPANISRQANFNIAQAAADKKKQELLNAATIAQGGGRFGSMLGGTAFQGAGIGADKLFASLSRFAPVAAVAAVALGAMTAAAVGFWKFTLAAVGKSNPVAMERYNRAWDDLLAIFGQRLAPVLNLATDGVRLVADAFHSILPSGKEVEQMFRGMKEAMKDARDGVGQAKPVLKSLFDSQIGNYLKFGSAYMSQQGSILRGLTGGRGAEQLNSSVGAAATARSFAGLEDLREKNMLLNMDTTITPPTKAQADETNTKLDLLIAVTREVSDPFGVRRGIFGF